MANTEKLTPADYDRWGRTCVKFYEDTPQTAAQLSGQPITSKPRHKQAIKNKTALKGKFKPYRAIKN